MTVDPLTVLKFGGSVLREPKDLPCAVTEIYRAVREGHRVIAVVSAFGGTTDRLLALAGERDPRPDSEAAALLLGTGETRSAALLALALTRAGVPATVRDAARIGLRADGPRHRSTPVSVDTEAIRRTLRDLPVLVVPGFAAVCADGAPVLLGRGGSDLTALFLADRCAATRCRLVKDVDGVYDRDPTGVGAARRYADLSWSDAARLDAPVVQPETLALAAKRRIEFEVVTPGRDAGTRIGPGPTAFAAVTSRPPHCRVGLLGLGTVGRGVYELLEASPDFDVTRIAVRHPEKHIADGIPADLLTTEPEAVVASDCDVLVELIGGRPEACHAIAAALSRGLDVVTANKSVIARDGAGLRRLAASRRCRLRFSAAVGGAVPVLESIRRWRATERITAVHGVFSGSTSYILDRLAEGVSFPRALAQARDAGLTEADPTLDLRGIDVAEKLCIVAREAYGVDLTPACVRAEGIDDVDPDAVARAAAGGQRVRLVGSVQRHENGQVGACIQRLALPAGDPLAVPRDQDIAVIIDTAAGRRRVIGGTGAGRWPTAESVVGDIRDVAALRRERVAPPVISTATGLLRGVA